MTTFNEWWDSKYNIEIDERTKTLAAWCYQQERINALSTRLNEILEMDVNEFAALDVDEEYWRWTDYYT